MMDQDPILERCEAMSEGALLRAVTVDRHQNSDRFRQVALGVLEERGLSLDQRLDRVRVRLDDGEESLGSVDAALFRLQDELALWQALVYTDCLGDVLVLQRESRGWTAHHYADEAYDQSYFVGASDRTRDMLALFLRLEDWSHLAGEGHRLDNWTAVAASDSTELIQKVAEDLDAADIPHTVQSAVFFAGGEDAMAVRVPPECVGEAHDLLDEAEESVEDLYEQAEEMGRLGNLARELEIYDLLVAEDPENPAVRYNRGNVLLELRQPEAAADGLIEAVALGMQLVKPDLSAGGGRGLSGLSGVVGLLFRKLVTTPEPRAAAPRYPDFIDDAEMLLDQLSAQLPTSTKVLHCLAAIARLKNDAAAAETRYRRILDLDPQDKVAYFNLGYLHSEQGGDGAASQSQPPDR